jgi:hypothetical protein
VGEAPAEKLTHIYNSNRFAIETLDQLRTLIYHTDASRLPEPNELARLLDRVRRTGVMTLEYGWMVQLTEAVEQPSRC